MRDGRESRQGSLSSAHPGSSHGVGAPALTGFGSSDRQLLWDRDRLRLRSLI